MKKELKIICTVSKGIKNNRMIAHIETTFKGDETPIEKDSFAYNMAVRGYEYIIRLDEDKTSHFLNGENVRQHYAKRVEMDEILTQKYTGFIKSVFSSLERDADIEINVRHTDDFISYMYYSLLT